MRKVFFVCSIVSIFATQTMANGAGQIGWGFIQCAPEVIGSNIDRVESALISLARNELSGSGSFNDFVSLTSSLSDSDKILHYRRVLGTKSDQEFAEFLGRRETEIPEVYVKNVQENLKLSKDQANVLVSALSSAFLGEVQ